MGKPVPSVAVEAINSSFEAWSSHTSESSLPAALNVIVHERSMKTSAGSSGCSSKQSRRARCACFHPYIPWKNDTKDEDGCELRCTCFRSAASFVPAISNLAISSRPHRSTRCPVTKPNDNRRSQALQQDLTSNFRRWASTGRSSVSWPSRWNVPPSDRPFRNSCTSVRRQVWSRLTRDWQEGWSRIKTAFLGPLPASRDTALVWRKKRNGLSTPSGRWSPSCIGDTEPAQDGVWGRGEVAEWPKAAVC